MTTNNGASPSKTDNDPLALYEDNPEFNQELDNDADINKARNEIKIAGSSFLPSRVLYQLEPETYQLAYLDYCARKRDEYKSIIWNEFPMPIAYSFYRAENGYENYIQRLYFLRDTWESLIRFLFAIVVSEYRCSNLSMEDTKIKMSEILSDNINIKLSIMEQLIRKSVDYGSLLESTKLIPTDVIEDIRELNQARNGFSHQAAKSEDQAAHLFGEYFDEVFNILEKLEFLKDTTLMRFVGAGSDALCPRFEVFTGHFMSKTIRSISLTPEENASCVCFLNSRHLLFKVASKIFSLTPLMHFIPDASSSYNKVCFFKKKEGEEPNQQFIYEVIRESIEIKLSGLEFKSEVDQFRGLLPDLSRKVKGSRHV